MRFLKETPVGTFNTFLLAGGWNLLNQVCLTSTFSLATRFLIQI